MPTTKEDDRVVELLEEAFDTIGDKNDPLRSKVRGWLWKALHILTHDLPGVEAIRDGAVDAVLGSKLNQFVRGGSETTLKGLVYGEREDLPANILQLAETELAERERKGRLGMSSQVFIELNRLGEMARRIQGPMAENYAGFVCAAIRGGERRDLPIMRKRGAAFTEVETGEIYRIAVWFEPECPLSCWSEEVFVNDGEDVPEVHFEVEVDSSAVRFRSMRRSVKFVPTLRSKAVEFQFTAPREVGRHEVWVQVFQNQQLIQGLLLAVEVGGSRGAKQSPMQPAPALRIEIKEAGGRRLVWRLWLPRAKRPIVVKTRVTCKQLGEARLAHETELSKIKDRYLIDSTDPFARLAAAFERLSQAGLGLMGQIFEGRSEAKIGRAKAKLAIEQLAKTFRDVRARVPSGTDTPLLIEMDAPIDRMMPIELLPLFRPKISDIDEEKLLDAIRRGDVIALRKLAAWFPGYSAIVRRILPYAPVRGGVLHNEPKLPIKFFTHHELKGVKREHEFFTQNERCIALDGPWPPAGGGATFPPSVTARARRAFHHLRRPRHDFNGSKQKATDQVHHFSCHCSTDEESSGSYVIALAGCPDSRVLISATDLMAEVTRQNTDGRRRENAPPLPLLFLNACGSGRILPEATFSFPEYFLRVNGNRGFIGTETPVPDGFAAEFARKFYIALLSGQRNLGWALHRARWQMLESQQNLLGLYYIAYADPTLRVGRPVLEVFDL